MATDRDGEHVMVVSNKLKSLAFSEGYETPEEMIEETIHDSVSPGICMNGHCNYICEVEPDQDTGWCEECQSDSVVSVLVLTGLI